MRHILRRLFAVLILVVLHGAADAQTMIDVVYLKNGSVIRGMIIEQVPNASLKVQTKDGSVFVYAIAEVEKITKEEEKVATEKRSTARSSQPSEYVRSGYVNITSLGIGLGMGSWQIDPPSGYLGKNRSTNYIRMETVNGFWLADGVVSLGLGAGLQYHLPTSNPDNLKLHSNAQLPVFVDIRAITTRGKVSPSFILQAGYSVGIIPAKIDAPSHYNLMTDRVFMNGMGIASGIGLHTEVSSNVVFNVSVMYDYQQFLYEIRWRGYDGYNYGYREQHSKYDTRFGALRISLGLAF